MSGESSESRNSALSSELSKRKMIAKSSKNAGDINKQIQDINVEESARFVADDERRRVYIAEHPTQIACFKCMDERVHMPTATGMPRGIVKPYRAVGGRFELFWPGLRKRLRTWINLGLDSGRRSVALVTYHYSASETLFGCTGWEYKTSLAKAHAKALCDQMVSVYGDYALTPILTGVETDGDELILHGPEGEVSGNTLIGLTSEQVRGVIRWAFPRLDARLVEDILPFMMGNASRVADLKLHPRDLTGLDHAGFVIALGQDFSWLARQNFALIINDFDPDLKFAIERAAKIIMKNLQSSSAEKQATLFTNIPYRTVGMEEREARAASIGLQRFAQHVIRAMYPDLWRSGKLLYLTGVTYASSQKLTVIEQGIAGT